MVFETCGVVDMRSSDALRRETKFVHAIMKMRKNVKKKRIRYIFRKISTFNSQFFEMADCTLLVQFSASPLLLYQATQSFINILKKKKHLS